MGEWRCEQTAVTMADRATVWAFWTNMDNHVELEDGVESIELDGPFVTGTTGRTRHADFEQEWELSDVVEGVGFGVKGYTPDRRGTLTFSWKLEDEGPGTRIEYRIEAQGPDVDQYVEVFRQLEINAPEGLSGLVAALDDLAEQAR
jgi:carbon monoxide dehydrogenase subunit G